MFDEKTLSVRYRPQHDSRGPEIDPVIALIAAEKRIRALAYRARDAMDDMFFAIPKDWRDRLHWRLDGYPEDLPEPMEQLYHRADFLEEAANEFFDRIAETKPKTIAGAIAMIEADVLADNVAFHEAALAGLREIAAKAE